MLKPPDIFELFLLRVFLLVGLKNMFDIFEGSGIGSMPENTRLHICTNMPIPGKIMLFFYGNYSYI